MNIDMAQQLLDQGIRFEKLAAFPSTPPDTQMTDSPLAKMTSAQAFILALKTLIDFKPKRGSQLWDI